MSETRRNRSNYELEAVKVINPCEKLSLGARQSTTTVTLHVKQTQPVMSLTKVSPERLWCPSAIMQGSYKQNVTGSSGTDLRWRPFAGFQRVKVNNTLRWVKATSKQPNH